MLLPIVVVVAIARQMGFLVHTPVASQRFKLSSRAT
jgi:hypothetical protein